MGRLKRLLSIDLLALRKLQRLGRGGDELAFGFNGLAGFGQLGADGDERLLEHRQAVLGLLQGSLQDRELGGVILLRGDAGGGELRVFGDMLGALLRDSDDFGLGRDHGFLGGGHPDGGFLHDLISRGDVRFGVGGGGGLGRLGLADRGQGGAGLGHRLLGLLLPGEVTEGEDGAESAGLTVGFFGGGELACGGLTGFGGFLDFGGSGAQGGLGGDHALLGLGVQDLGGGDGLLQFINLGGQFSDTGPKGGSEFIAIGARGGGGDRHDRIAILAQTHDGLGLSVDELLLRLDLTHGFGFADPERRKGLIEGGELHFERLEGRGELRQFLFVLGDGLLRGLDARGGGDLGGFVLRLGGDEVSDVLLELGQLVLFGEHPDVELGGLERDQALAMGGGLGDDVPDVRLGGGQLGLGLDEVGLSGAESRGDRTDLVGLLGEVGDGGALRGDGLGGLLLLRGRLRLGGHTLPVYQALLLFDLFRLVLGQFLCGRFAFGLRLGQRGFSGRNPGFGGLGGGFGGGERGRQFGQALFGRG